MARSCMQIYFSSRRMFDKLDNAQLGNVLRAAMDYAEKAIEPAGLSSAEQIAFESMRVYLDRDAEKYEKKCARMRENGSKGGRPNESARAVFNEMLKDKSSFQQEKPNRGASSSSNSNSSSSSSPSGDTRACARGAAPPPPTTPEDLWIELGFGKSRSYAGQCLAEFRAAGCTDGLIRRALEIAADNGACRWAYARAILQHAAAAGTLTVQAFEAARRPPGSGRNTPVTRQPPGPGTDDFIRAAAARPRRLKRRDTAHAPTSAAESAQDAPEAAGPGNNSTDP